MIILGTKKSKTVPTVHFGGGGDNMRNRILAATIEEMRERGIKFTMNDLARRIGVSKRCLYEYFESKEALISCIVDASLVDIVEQRRKIISDESLSFREKLKAIPVRATVFSPLEGRIAEEIKRYMPKEWMRIDQFMSEDWKFVEDFLKAGIESGELRSVHLPILHKMVRGSINELVDYHFLDKNGISLTQAKTYMFDILLYGMVSG
jgi:Transcriptional regulator